MTCAAAVLERPPRRLTRPKAADREAALLAAGRGACPVLCVDALLPYQRLPLNFDDGTLAELLDDVGEGGLVMATSWDPRRRRVRRQGTLARVEGEALRGVARCAVAGGDARVGRWRRYGATVAPGTAGAALRWGRERLTDATRTRRATPIARGFVVDCVGVDAAAEPPAPDEASPLEWSATRIDVAPPDAGDPACVERAAALAALFDEWASVTTPWRLAAALDAAGPRPADPVDFAVWCAAVARPPPPLGGGFDVRPVLLESLDGVSRLVVAEHGLRRSLAELAECEDVKAFGALPRLPEYVRAAQESPGVPPPSLRSDRGLRQGEA